MHVNPIKSRPLSPEGRENYDRIFRKGVVDLPPTLEEAIEEFRDKQHEKARELHHEMARQKHLDESA